MNSDLVDIQVRLQELEKKVESLERTVLSNAEYIGLILYPERRKEGSE